MVCYKREALHVDMKRVEFQSKKLQHTIAVFKQLAIPSHEPLDALLDRTKEVPAKKKTKKTEEASEAISEVCRNKWMPLLRNMDWHWVHVATKHIIRWSGSMSLRERHIAAT